MVYRGDNGCDGTNSAGENINSMGMGCKRFSLGYSVTL